MREFEYLTREAPWCNPLTQKECWKEFGSYCYLSRWEVSWSHFYNKFVFYYLPCWSELISVVGHPHHWCASMGINLVTSDLGDVTAPPVHLFLLTNLNTLTGNKFSQFFHYLKKIRKSEEVLRFYRAKNTLPIECYIMWCKVLKCWIWFAGNLDQHLLPPSFN